MNDKSEEKKERVMELLPESKSAEFVQWIETLNVDERLMILLASAKLDDILKRLLQAVMLHPGGSNDSLFDSDRPLGTFSSRILLAYRLGLISRDFEKFLQALRKLRNDAAHSSGHMDLSSSPHRDFIETMQSFASKGPYWKWVHSLNQGDPIRASLFASLTSAVVNGVCAVADAKPFEVATQCTFNLLDPLAGRTQEEIDDLMA